MVSFIPKTDKLLQDSTHERNPTVATRYLLYYMNTVKVLLQLPLQLIQTLRYRDFPRSRIISSHFLNFCQTIWYFMCIPVSKLPKNAVYISIIFTTYSL